MSGGGLVVSYANCDGDGGYVAANSTMPNLVRSSSMSCSANVSFKGEFAPLTHLLCFVFRVFFVELVAGFCMNPIWVNQVIIVSLARGYSGSRSP